MTIRERLDAAIGERRLLDHPFYVAWREGTLPREAIAGYAAEYGAFIAAIDEGWATVGELDHAAEEREHAMLWDRFAAAFGTATAAQPSVPAVMSLLDASHRLFADPATAYGALYAFEVQQPDTAAEKLLGLDAHYGVPADAAESEYFRVHAGDYHEAAGIVTALDHATTAEQTRAVEACEEMASALWDALSGVSPSGV